MTYGLNVSSLDGSQGFRLDGIAAGDYSGISVAGIGDVNGDGIGDLIIGAHLADPNGSNSGQAYVVYGTTSGFPASLDLATLTRAQGFTLNGAAVNDLAGFSVSAAGDFNGDGKADFLVSSFGADSNGTDAGTTYVVFGQTGNFSANLALASLHGSTGVSIIGADAGAFAGISVAPAGDVNGDGFDDIILGATGGWNGVNTVPGAAYIVFGKAAGFGSPIDLATLDTAGLKIVSDVQVGHFSQHVSGNGDFNGDGFADVIISSYGANSYSGKAFVVFGAADLGGTLSVGSLDGSNGFAIAGSSTQFVGWSVGNAGDVNGDGIDDLIIGASNTNTDGVSGAEGAAYVVFGKSGGFDATFDVASVNGSNGFRLDGEVNFAGFAGLAVASAGDVNGDGIADMLVSAKKAPNLAGDAGAVYLLFGKSTGFAADIDLGHLKGQDGFRIDGNADGDNLGFSVGSAGDINGDGFDDIIFSAYKASPNGLGHEGASYVIFGRATLTLSPQLELADLSSDEGFRMLGGFGSVAGYAVSSAGDVNGDGIDDMLISGPGNYDIDPGHVYVVYGKSGNRATDLTLDNLTAKTGFTISGVGSSDHLGTAVAQAGDVNGDGIGDFIVSTSAASTARGETYVVFGKAGGFGQNFDLTHLNGTNGFRLHGTSKNDYSGVSVASGDINGDGFADIIVGASGRDSNGVNAGSAYVFFGGQTFAAVMNLSDLNGTNGFRLDGPQPRAFSAADVASAGDVDGDGIDDVLIGGVATSFGSGHRQGAAYLFFGKDAGFSAATNLATLDGHNGYMFQGVKNKDYAGLSVASAGDVNGDGFADILISASGADTAGVDSGSSYLVFGGTANLAALDAKGGPVDGTVLLSQVKGAFGLRLDGATAGEYSGYSVSGAGDVNGDGFDDLIIGAYRAGSPQDAMTGSTYVVYGKATGFGSVLDLGALDGTDGFRIDGEPGGSRSGFSVSAAGDVNHDGIADILVGATRANGATGAAYVIYGLAPTFAVHRVGSVADQTIFGGVKNDWLEGKSGADTLIGGAGNDTVTGGVGRDVLSGQAGKDTFDFNSLSELGKTAQTRDEITDFSAGARHSFVDRIDLIGLDADTGTNGHQAFDFIGTKGFTHHAGELQARHFGNNTIISGDVDGDGKADFQIQIDGLVSLFANDFLL
ncbi:MAG: hypothetical protein ABI832_14585 [bacterium]